MRSREILETSGIETIKNGYIEVQSVVGGNATVALEISTLDIVETDREDNDYTAYADNYSVTDVTNDRPWKASLSDPSARTYGWKFGAFFVPYDVDRLVNRFWENGDFGIGEVDPLNSSQPLDT